MTTLSNLDADQIIQNVHDGTKEALKVTQISGALVTVAFDAVAVTYPNSTTEVYTYKTGGISGTTVAIVTLTYTDSTKVNLSQVVKS